MIFTKGKYSTGYKFLSNFNALPHEPDIDLPGLELGYLQLMSGSTLLIHCTASVKSELKEIREHAG